MPYIQLPNKKYLEVPAGLTDDQAIEFAQKKVPFLYPELDQGIVERAGRALRRGIGQPVESASGIALGARAALGDMTGAQRGIDEFKKSQEAESKEPQGLSIAGMYDQYKSQGLLPALSNVPAYVTEQVLQNAPSMALPFAAAKAGAAFAGPLGGLAAGIGTYGVQQYGQFMNTQAGTEGRTAATLEPIKALGTAAATAPFGYFFDRFMLGLSKVPAKAAANLINKEIAARGVGQTLARGAARGLLEVPTEVLEQVAERWQAGQSLTDKDAVASYIEAAGGALALGSTAGAGFAYKQRGEAQQQVTEQEQLDRSKERNQARIDTLKTTQEAEAARLQDPAYKAKLFNERIPLVQRLAELKATLKAGGKTIDPADKKEIEAEIKAHEKRIGEIRTELQNIGAEVPAAPGTKSRAQIEAELRAKQEFVDEEGNVIRTPQQVQAEREAGVEDYYAKQDAAAKVFADKERAQKQKEEDAVIEAEYAALYGRPRKVKGEYVPQKPYQREETTFEKSQREYQEQGEAIRANRVAEAKAAAEKEAKERGLITDDYGNIVSGKEAVQLGLDTAAVKGASQTDLTPDALRKPIDVGYVSPEVQKHLGLNLPERTEEQIPAQGELASALGQKDSEKSTLAYEKAADEASMASLNSTKGSGLPYADRMVTAKEAGEKAIAALKAKEAYAQTSVNLAKKLKPSLFDKEGEAIGPTYGQGAPEAFKGYNLNQFDQAQTVLPEIKRRIAELSRESLDVAQQGEHVVDGKITPSGQKLLDIEGRIKDLKRLERIATDAPVKEEEYRPINKQLETLQEERTDKIFNGILEPIEKLRSGETKGNVAKEAAVTGKQPTITARGPLLAFAQKNAGEVADMAVQEANMIRYVNGIAPMTATEEISLRGRLKVATDKLLKSNVAPIEKNKQMAERVQRLLDKYTGELDIAPLQIAKSLFEQNRVTNKLTNATEQVLKKGITPNTLRVLNNITQGVAAATKGQTNFDAAIKNVDAKIEAAKNRGVATNSPEMQDLFRRAVALEKQRKKGIVSSRGVAKSERDNFVAVVEGIIADASAKPRSKKQVTAKGLLEVFPNRPAVSPEEKKALAENDRKKAELLSKEARGENEPTLGAGKELAEVQKRIRAMIALGAKRSEVNKLQQLLSAKFKITTPKELANYEERLLDLAKLEKEIMSRGVGTGELNRLRTYTIGVIDQALSRKDIPAEARKALEDAKAQFVEGKGSRSTTVSKTGEVTFKPEPRVLFKQLGTKNKITDNVRQVTGTPQQIKYDTTVEGSLTAALDLANDLLAGRVGDVRAVKEAIGREKDVLQDNVDQLELFAEPGREVKAEKANAGIITGVKRTTPEKFRQFQADVATKIKKFKEALNKKTDAEVAKYAKGVLKNTNALQLEAPGMRSANRMTTKAQLVERIAALQKSLLVPLDEQLNTIVAGLLQDAAYYKGLPHTKDTQRFADRAMYLEAEAKSLKEAHVLFAGSDLTTSAEEFATEVQQRLTENLRVLAEEQLNRQFTGTKGIVEGEGVTEAFTENRVYGNAKIKTFGKRTVKRSAELPDLIGKLSKIHEFAERLRVLRAQSFVIGVYPKTAPRYMGAQANLDKTVSSLASVIQQLEHTRAIVEETGVRAGAIEEAQTRLKAKASDVRTITTVEGIQPQVRVKEERIATLKKLLKKATTSLEIRGKAATELVVAQKELRNLKNSLKTAIKYDEETQTKRTVTSAKDIEDRARLAAMDKAAYQDDLLEQKALQERLTSAALEDKPSIAADLKEVTTRVKEHEALSSDKVIEDLQNRKELRITGALTRMSKALRVATNKRTVAQVGGPQGMAKVWAAARNNTSSSVSEQSKEFSKNFAKAMRNETKKHWDSLDKKGKKALSQLRRNETALKNGVAQNVSDALKYGFNLEIRQSYEELNAQIAGIQAQLDARYKEGDKEVIAPAPETKMLAMRAKGTARKKLTPKDSRVEASVIDLETQLDELTGIAGAYRDAISRGYNERPRKKADAALTVEEATVAKAQAAVQRSFLYGKQRETAADIRAASDAYPSDESNARNIVDVDGTAFHLAKSGKAEGGVRFADAQAVANRIKANLPKGINLTYAPLIKNIPLKFLNAIAAEGVDVRLVQGMVLSDGSVLVIGETHSSTRDVEATFSHELIGHYSIDTLLNKKGLTDIVDRLFARGNQHVAEVATGLGVFPDIKTALYATEGLDADAKLAVVREMIAHAAEGVRVAPSRAGVVIQFIKDMIAAVRSWMRSLGLSEMAKLETKALQAHVREASKAYAQGRIGEYRGEVGATALRAKPMPAGFEAIQDFSDAAIAQPQSFYGSMKGVKNKSLAAKVSFVDRLAAVEEVAEQAMREGKSNEALQMMYFLQKQLDLLSMASASAFNGAIGLVEDAPGEFRVQSIEGASLRSVDKALKPLLQQGFNAEQANKLFTAYMLTLRGEHEGYNKLNFNPEVIQMAREVIPAINSNKVVKDILNEARTQYNEYNRGMVDFAEKTGAITPEAAKEMRDKGDYIPYYRDVGGILTLYIGAGHPIKLGDLKNQPHLQRLVGGEEKIMDYFNSSMQNTLILTDLSLRNLAVKNTAHTFNTLGLLETSTGKDGKEHAIRNGDGPANANVLRFRDKGVDKHVVVRTEGTAYEHIPTELLVKGMEGTSIVMPKMVEMLAIPAKVLRRGITLNPLYPYYQLVKDSMAMGATKGVSYSNAANAIKGIKQYVSGDKLIKELQAKGVISEREMFTGTVGDIARVRNRVLEGEGTLHKFIAGQEARAVRADGAVRAMLYSQYIKDGLNARDAEYMAIKAMPYSRRGLDAGMRYLSHMIPFFNAQVVGLYSMYQSLLGKGPLSAKLNIKKKLYTAGMSMAVSTLAYTSLVAGSDWYENMPIETRLRNWLIKLPGMKEPLAIPIPFEFGIIFKAFFEATYLGMFNSTPEGKKVREAFNSLIFSSIPGGTISVGDNVRVPFPVPTIALPILELAVNKSLNTGNPIENERELGVIPSERFRDTTSETAKSIGRMSGTSPLAIDHLIRGYTGTVGPAVISLVDALTGPAIQGAGVKTETMPSKFPLLGQLFKPADGGALIDLAVDALKTADVAMKTYEKMAAEPGRQKEAEAYRIKNDEAIQRGAMAGKLRERLGMYAKEERAIRADDKMSPREKRLQLESLKRDKIEESKGYMQAFRSGA